MSRQMGQLHSVSMAMVVPHGGLEQAEDEELLLLAGTCAAKRCCALQNGDGERLRSLAVLGERRG